MRSNTKILGAVAIAGLVAAGGSAFTATSTVDQATRHIGATSQAITGVTVDSVNYTVGASDVTTAVSFHVAEVLGTGDTVTAVITSGTVTGAAGTATDDCTAAAATVGTDLTCSFGTGVANVTSLQITAH
jgi:hypothetical protein